MVRVITIITLTKQLNIHVTFISKMYYNCGLNFKSTMKNLILPVLLALLCTTTFAQSDNPPANKAGANKIIDTAAMAKVYVIRSTGHVASAINIRLVVDDVLMCKVRNNRYAVVFVQPGTHLFNATTWDKAGAHEKFALKIPVEAGKTYYTSMRIKPRFAITEIFLEEITYNTAAPLLTKYKLDECD
jgi:hypothetical protein